MIEKRYRTNLNEKIAALRDAVPSLRAMSKANGSTAEDDDAEDLEGLTPAHKLNKATVLSKATEYIHHLEKRCRRMQEEMNTLKSRLDTIEKYSMTGAMPMAMVSTVGTPTGRMQDDPFTTATAGPSIAAPNPPQGMIPVPRSMANLHRSAYHGRPDVAGGQMFSPYGSGAMHPATPQDQAQAMAAAAAAAHGHQRPMQGQPMINRRDGANRFMNKLMVGSLAGLMLLEGFHEHEQSSDTPSGRGLFAAPIQLLLRLGPKMPSDAAMNGASILQRALPLLKSLGILAAIVYLLMPLLTFNAKRSKRPLPLLRLTPAPSLASPIEVRRTAWLTAIQTVWVPQHNFLLEVAALCLKTLKLSTRKLIGWQGYALLTGITKEQEAARVKAWEIALDAQLTGGDAEISISRLILTLMASGTLPDTPAQLMLKALHIRVLLWEVATAGYGGWYLFDELCLKIARSYWASAQQEHRLAVINKDDSSVEPLPPHLAALLQLECDDVLLKTIVQRAYNLAWNRPSAEKARPDEAMDSVIEDFAISSPLDALSAWWSTHMLNTAMALYLDDATGDNEPLDELDLSWMERLQLAIDTAPPLTGAWTRALVAKAVLVDSDRTNNIAQALEALPSQSDNISITDSPGSIPRTRLMNIINQTPAGPDVQTALTLAKCLALSDRVGPTTFKARASAAHVVNNYLIPENAFSTLSMVAAYKLIDAFADDDELFVKSKQGLERLTMAIRMWVGGDSGGACGVEPHTRGQIVERCLVISKKLVGMYEDKDIEIDAGYHTQSDADAILA